MIMTDQVKTQERLDFSDLRHQFYLEVCEGCGRDSNEIVNEQGCSYIELESNSVKTKSGLWYCHHDCSR